MSKWVVPKIYTDAEIKAVSGSLMTVRLDNSTTGNEWIRIGQFKSNTFFAILQLSHIWNNGECLPIAVSITGSSYVAFGARPKCRVLSSKWDARESFKKIRIIVVDQTNIYVDVQIGDKMTYELTLTSIGKMEVLNPAKTVSDDKLEGYALVEEFDLSDDSLY